MSVLFREGKQAIRQNNKTISLYPSAPVNALGRLNKLKLKYAQQIVIKRRGNVMTRWLELDLDSGCLSHVALVRIGSQR